jgi:hypothetical protein
MKPSPSKTSKAAGKKRGREEAAAAATEAAPPMSPPLADPSREWKKSKAKTEDLLTLVNSGFIREKGFDMWRSAAGDPYPMEKSEDWLEEGLLMLAKENKSRRIGEGSSMAQEGGAQQNYVPPFGGIPAPSSYYDDVPMQAWGVVQPCPHQILWCPT